MKGNTNANVKFTLKQKYLGNVTTGGGVRTAVDDNCIVLARIISIQANDMIYIRIDSASDVEQRQYGSYGVAGQQVMITGFANKGEKIRMTGASGSTAQLYIVSVGGGGVN